MCCLSNDFILAVTLQNDDCPSWQLYKYNGESISFIQMTDQSSPGKENMKLYDIIMFHCYSVERGENMLIVLGISLWSLCIRLLLL